MLLKTARKVTPAGGATVAESDSAPVNVTLEFNTPMDRASVEAAFVLTTDSDTLPLSDDASFVNPATFDRLTLTSMCEGRWRVRNPNADAIRFTWDVAGQTEAGAGIVPANADVFFNTIGGSQTTRLFVNDQQQQVKASNPNPCDLTTQVKGSFSWIDDPNVVFTPGAGLEPGEYTLDLSDAAISKQGQALLPFRSSFTVSASTTPPYHAAERPERITRALAGDFAFRDGQRVL